MMNCDAKMFGYKLNLPSDFKKCYTKNSITFQVGNGKSIKFI